eukprot:TRINITY_DN2260_c0_g1_i1.p1 TRINITY_DN2260_c0_g1~~TRINITY_DN2260_c0_g1_i1.p1  ORF type:complete len:311 (-),score=107.27 TRINITY_DN2260_c0_g1_i1:199-1131(-)
MGSGASTEQRDAINVASVDDMQKALKELSTEDLAKLAAALKAASPLAADTKSKLDAAWTKLKEMVEKAPDIVEETDAMAKPPPGVEEIEAALCKLSNIEDCTHDAAKILWKGDSASAMGASLLASLKKIETEASAKDIKAVLDPLVADKKLEKLGAVSMLFNGIGQWLGALHAHCAAAQDTKAQLDAAWTKLKEMIEKQPELVEEVEEMMSAPPSIEECEAALCKLSKIDGCTHAAAKALWKGDSPSAMGAALLASLKKIETEAGAKDIKAALEPLVADKKLEKLGAASMLFGRIGQWLQALYADCADKA